MKYITILYFFYKIKINYPTCQFSKVKNKAKVCLKANVICVDSGLF